MRNNHYVVLDIETGGKSHTKNPVTEVAMAELDPLKFKVLNKYSSFVKPYNNLVLEEEALTFSKITKAMLLKEGKDVKVIVQEMIHFLSAANPQKSGKGREFGKPVLIAHNSLFDFMFIYFMFQIAGKDLLEYVSNTIGDTLFLSKMTWDEDMNEGGIDASHKLSSSCARAGIKFKDAHRAENDVGATGKLVHYFGGRIRNKINVSEDRVLEDVNEYIPDESNSFRETFEF